MHDDAPYFRVTVRKDRTANPSAMRRRAAVGLGTGQEVQGRPTNQVFL